MVVGSKCEVAQSSSHRSLKSTMQDTGGLLLLGEAKGPPNEGKQCYESFQSASYGLCDVKVDTCCEEITMEVLGVARDVIPHNKTLLSCY